MQEGLAVGAANGDVVGGPEVAESRAGGLEAGDESGDEGVLGAAAGDGAEVGDELAGAGVLLLRRTDGTDGGIGEPAPDVKAAVAGETSVVAGQQDGSTVLGEGLAEVGQHQGRGV